MKSHGHASQRVTQSLLSCDSIKLGALHCKEKLPSVCVCHDGWHAVLCTTYQQKTLISCKFGGFVVELKALVDMGGKLVVDGETKAPQPGA